MGWKNWRGRELNKKVRDAVSDGMVAGGEAIAGVVLQQVPHDTGALSKTVQVLQNPNDKTEVVLTAGGGPGTGFPLIPYALRWHENPARFQKGRKHNYIRDPIKQAQSNNTVAKAIAQELQKVL